MRQYVVARSLNSIVKTKFSSASIIIPCKNEQGNIEAAIKRLPIFAKDIEVIFIEGNSSDKTWEKIQLVKKKYSNKKKGFTIKSFKQKEKERQRLFFMDLKKLQKKFYLF